MLVTLVTINLVVHLLLPAAFLLWTALGRHRSRARFLAVGALTAAYLLFVGQVGAGWAWFGLWWPWLWYASFPVACGVWLVRRWRAAPWWPERRVLPIAGLAFTIVLAASLLSTIPLVLQAHRYEGEALELQPPLSGGSIVVGHGGGNAVLNQHALVPAQRYALDILGLDGASRADGLYPDALTAYAIWGRPVIAPCAGRVVAVESGLPDIAPGLPAGKREDAAGNHVVLRCGAHHVILAHLQRGSVAVEPGVDVAVGQRLGVAGNSGNTSEPHLHIHALAANAGDRDELLWKGSGVPITFGGRFLVRGDTADW